MDEFIIWVKDIRLLLRKLNVSKSLTPDEIHLKRLKYLSSKESFMQCKFIEKCIEYEMIPSLWKTAKISFKE